ncbi:MAG: response regulator [Tenuifilaceae bacterium]|jgi:CheY-like chemotaxis protein|uniref:response regulator n=1 Tax=Perlabentimonas gracilis TaxID=2715279 RepID=UPI001408CE02|nr:response regulator [Perlabentimonas gracilis]MDX9770681.1 response regulator [Tenuifilaceae bacterium]NHB68005.1 response regulator [Perlabentimonas gracilis]
MTTILVVDDSLIGRHVVEAMLSSLSYNLEFAVDGQEALDKAIELKPTLIILDIMMPKIDGIEVTKLIRKHEVISETPIIIFTALDDKDTKNRALKAGANSVLVKPIRKTLLKETIEAILDTKGN